jgi:plasmid stabilization system protein ParE
VSLEIKTSAQFRKDAVAILEFIGADDANAARGMLVGLTRKLDLLRSRPLALRLRPELGQDMRVLRVSSYLVVYRVDDATVFVERMVHTSRDLETLFNNEDT